MATSKLVIHWPALFNAAPFRTGWAHARGALPIDHNVHEDVDHEIRAAMDAIYALGRMAAIEAPGMGLPDIRGYFSMQMRLLLSACPEMEKEMKLSSLRHFLNPEQKNNVQ